MSIFSRTLALVMGTAFAALIILVSLTVNFSQSYINENLNERLESLVRGQEIKVEQALGNLLEIGPSISDNSLLSSKITNYIVSKKPKDFVAIRQILSDYMASSSVLVRIDVLSSEGSLLASLGDLKNITKSINLIDENELNQYSFFRISKTKIGKTYIHTAEPIIYDGKLQGVLKIVLDVTSSIETLYDNSGFGEKGSSQVFVMNSSNQWVELKNLNLVADINPKVAIKKVSYDGFINSFFSQRTPFITIDKLIPGRKIAVEVNISSNEVFSTIDKFYKQLFTAFLIVLISTLFLGLWFSKQITNPITVLNRKVGDIAQGKKDVDIKFIDRDPTEIITLSINIRKMAQSLWRMNEDLEGIVEERTGQLKRLTENLELAVDERTREFQEANTQLLGALEDLHDAKNELVKAEKMASLGELVAGVAHEINTPLGVAVTGVSQAISQLNTLEKNKNGGSLTASNFDKYILDNRNLLVLMTEQLNVASSLIKNFKEVAVDQNNFDVRDLNLEDYLQKVFDTVRPKYKPTNIQLKLTCPKDIDLSTRPGAFSQVISNLLINALIHGYDKNDSGTVNVVCSSKEDSIIVVIKDDGKGIAEGNIDKIFDPFYTTKRGQGGSGLGLSIVFNIVTEALQGKIEVESELDKGSQFTIEIPTKLKDL